MANTIKTGRMHHDDHLSTSVSAAAQSATSSSSPSERLHDIPEEVLVIDRRTEIRPAQMVEQKLIRRRRNGMRFLSCCATVADRLAARTEALLIYLSHSLSARKLRA